MKRLIILIALMTSVGMAAMAQKTHVVQRGETLETIANSYNITIEALQQANNMISTVYAGKKLTIPVGQQPTNSVAAAPAPRRQPLPPRQVLTARQHRPPPDSPWPPSIRERVPCPTRNATAGRRSA